MSTTYDEAYDEAREDAADHTLRELITEVQRLAEKQPHVTPAEQARYDAFDAALDERLDD